jgi:hypothetical protein
MQCHTVISYSLLLFVFLLYVILVCEVFLLVSFLLLELPNSFMRLWFLVGFD